MGELDQIGILGTAQMTFVWGYIYHIKTHITVIYTIMYAYNNNLINWQYQQSTFQKDWLTDRVDWEWDSDSECWYTNVYRIYNPHKYLGKRDYRQFK